jgi:hypothetical protein
VGNFIPATTAATLARPSISDGAPELSELTEAVIQSNDVDLDYRGLAYLSDRAGTGLHIIEYLPAS